MKSIDEQLGEVLRRAERMKELRAIRRRMWASGISAAACAVLMMAVSFFASEIPAAQSEAAAWRYGSLILTAPYFGYVLIGVLAFLLGASVALLCLQWRKLKRREREAK